ncbi:response regulator [Vibrio ponticus]|uniref:Response regulator n=1 Tax=Vibrio ponticus TaxID=265668 RepID=A0A3N3DZP4_9VIBR|nr:response regulator [Vibrio ponticus]ROV59862.1 response regulator [Vibrio ponticus]
MRKINTSFLKSLRVLIVDDSSTALLLIKQQLVSLGVEHDNVITVERYQDAIKAMETHHFNVLILDYHLEQHLTGYELAMLLYRNRLISNATGVLIISGDARQETVLTALSGKVRHFVTKPLSNTSLAEKLYTIHRESQKLNQISDTLREGNKLSPASMFELINRSGFSISLEAYLIEHLISDKQWDFLDLYITMSSTPCHAAKVCAIAGLLHRENNTKQALEELHQFLTENPLSIKVIDLLADLYAESGQYKQAATWATKAFELTPSIGERAAKASEFNTKVNKKSQLLKVGITYAQHISLADINWLKTVITHFQCLYTTYTLTESTPAKTELMIHANKFVRFASRKLTPKRLQQLQAVLLLAHCHVLIHENNEMLAHQKLLQSLSHFYDELFECPPALLTEYLPALGLFGEQQIHTTIINVLQSRGIKAPIAHQYSEPVANNQSDVIPIDFTSSANGAHCLNRYPHSSEAKMYYLYNNSPSSSLTTEKQEQVNKILAELSVLDLPPNWRNWLTIGRQHGFTTAPPDAFSLTTLG